MDEVHPDQRRLLQAAELTGADAGQSRWALLWLVAGLIAAAARALQHYEHGIWLVAYLLLVGSLAQYLLGRGQAAVLAPSGPSTTRIRTEVGLWNFGVVTVPAGVLLDVRLLVVVGSVALLGALAAFRPSVEPSTDRAAAAGGSVRFGYWSLIAFMGVSVFVGVALAWDIPWT